MGWKTLGRTLGAITTGLAVTGLVGWSTEAAWGQSQPRTVNDATETRQINIFDPDRGNFNMTDLINAARSLNRPTTAPGLQEEALNNEVTRFQRQRPVIGPGIFQSESSEPDLISPEETLEGETLAP